MHARLLAGLSQWLRWHWYDRQVSCARVCQWRDMDGLLLYLCLLGCLQSSVVAWLMQTNGKLSSEHRVVYVGENITLHCHKNKNFAGDVRFKAGNTLVPMEYVTVVNSTYARMVKPATADDPMEITYTCRDNDTLLIGSKTINTEYQPQKAENLTVVWYDRRTAIFSWDFGVEAYKFRPDNQNQNNPVTNITASYSEDNVTWIECPAADYLSSNTSCRVDSFRWLQSVAVRVQVHNEFRNDTEDSIFYIDTVTKFEKPKPVQRLSVNARNSTCVRLTWYNDRVQLRTTVKYGRQDSALDREKKVPEDEDNTMICNLHPAYSYRFKVHAVPRHGYPSEPVNMTIKMPDAGRV